MHEAITWVCAQRHRVTANNARLTFTHSAALSVALPLTVAVTEDRQRVLRANETNAIYREQLLAGCTGFVAAAIPLEAGVLLPIPRVVLVLVPIARPGRRWGIDEHAPPYAALPLNLRCRTWHVMFLLLLPCYSTREPCV